MIIPSKESAMVEFKPTLNEAVIVALVAFINAKGGTVYVGVSDKGKAFGLTLARETVPKFLNEVKHKTSPSLVPDVEVIDIDGGKSVVALSVAEYPTKPVSTFGKYFKRVNASNHQMTADDIVNMRLQVMNTSWDMCASPIHTLDDLSLTKVRKCMALLRKNKITVDKSVPMFLSKCDLVRDGRPTFGAYLMFTKKEETITTIELGRFQDPITIKDSARTKSDIITQVDEVIDYVRKHINLEVIITGDPYNIQKWQYPMEAIREIVLNMIIHRDYRSPSDSIVKIFNDKIEFYNPGRLPDSITVEDLLSNNYKSTPRNRKIAGFFKDMGLIEKYGSGISRIIGYFKDANLPLPEFRNISEGFQVTVFSAESIGGTGVNNNAKVTVKDTVKVTENQRSIMYELTRDPFISAEKLSTAIGISERKIKENIKKLKANKMIERIGSDKNGYWRVLTENGNKMGTVVAEEVTDDEVDVVNDCGDVTDVPVNVPNDPVNEPANVPYAPVDGSDEPVNEPEKRLVAVINLMKNNDKISIPKLAEILNVNHSTVKRDIQKLKAKGIIERVGADKNGCWVVKHS